MPRIIYTLTIASILSYFTPYLYSQTEKPVTYPQDSKRLAAISRNLWSPVEIQDLQLTSKSQSDQTSLNQIKLACLYLEAAIALNPENKYAYYDQLHLYTSEYINDSGRAALAFSQSAIHMGNNDVLNSMWLSYKLSQFNDRESKEGFLEKTLSIFNFNPILLSDIFVQLGILATEKSDTESARQFFMQANSLNQYNTQAILNFINLPLQFDASKNPDQLQQASEELHLKRFSNIAYWRTRIRNNPYDLNATIEFIQAAENYNGLLLTDPFYEHAYKLVKFYPDKNDLLFNLKKNQMITRYATSDFKGCIELCKEIINTSPENLTAKTYMAKSLAMLNDHSAAKVIYSEIDANNLIQLNTDGKNIDKLIELGWYFTLIKVNQEKSNQIIKTLNSSSPKPLILFNALINNKLELSETLLVELDPFEPINALAFSIYHLQKNDTQSAHESLAGLLHIPKGIIGEEILKLLKQFEDKHKGLPDAKQLPTMDDYLNSQKDLKNTFDAYFPDKLNELKIVSNPNEVIKCYLRSGKSNHTYAYGEPILLECNLTNMSDSPYMLNSDCAINPHVLIEAKIHDHSVENKRSPKNSHTSRVIGFRNLKESFLLQPNRTNQVIDFGNIGFVHETMNHHPQNEYKITYNMILDPVINQDNHHVQRIGDLKQNPVTITRKAFDVNTKSIARLMKTINKANTKERLQAIFTASGLLHESILSKQGKINYPLRPVDSQSLFKILLNQLDDTDFRIRAWTIASLRDLPKPTLKSANNRLSKLLNDDHWFVRFMAIQTIEKAFDLKDYYEWAADEDKNIIIKRYAQMKLNRPWKKLILKNSLTTPTQENPTTPNEEQN